MQKIVGYFTKNDTVFRDENNGFTITRFICEDLSSVKIKGTFLDIPEGFIEIAITDIENSKYGKTYVVGTYKPFLPKEKNSVLTYLEKYLKLTNNQASRIYNFYTEKKLDIFVGLDNHAEDLDELKGLFKKEENKKAFLEKKAEEKNMREVRFFLYDYGFSETQAKAILKFYKTDSVERIKKNPYNLLSLDGITFNAIDRLFFDNGGERTNTHRILWGYVYFLNEYVKTSKNLYLDYATYRNYIEEKLNITFTDEIFAMYLKQTQEKYDNHICKDQVIALNIKDRGLFIMLQSYMRKTNLIAKNINLLLSQKIEKKYVLPEDYKTLDNGGAINEDQVNAIENCFNERLSIITGYGGTGKSTIIKKVVEIAEERGETYTLLAPTGKAVDVLINVTNRPDACFTIHRKLEILDNNTVEVAPLGEDIILIDESSMQDFNLMCFLFMAASFEITKKKIIIMGDDNQLKPVGIGSPFLDIIKSGVIPQTKLTKIYRQKKDSSILDNSKKIIEETPLDFDQTSDWEFINILGMNETKLRNSILEKIQFNGWDGERDAVISAKYKGEAGITKLNEHIQSYIQRENVYKYEKGIHKFYLGDRVMNISKNIYEEEGRVLAMPSRMMIDKKYEDGLKALTGSLALPKKYFYYNPKTNKVLRYEEAEEIKVIGEFGEQGFIKDGSKGSYSDIPDRNVYNGNWGTIQALLTDDHGWVGYAGDKTVKKLNIDVKSLLGKKNDEYVALVDFGDKYFFYTKKELNHLSLFYASTVHKMQGSQFHTVYAVCSPRDFFMTDKNWLYTMISRTQEKIYYFSTEEATRISQHNRGEPRKSFLPDFIRMMYKEGKAEEKRKKN